MKMCLNGIFDSAIENDLCIKNPARNIKATSNLVSDEKQTYTQAETDEITRLCSGHRHGIYVWILLELGLRCGELCGLRWSDFDFDEMTVSIQRAVKVENKKVVIGKVKNKTSNRVLPMSTELCELLKKRCAKIKCGSEFLLKSRLSADGLPISPDRFTSWKYKSFFEDMNIERQLNPHECRHTCGTLLYERTHDIFAVSKFLGHANIKITSKLYVHESPGMLRTALKIK